MREHEKRYRSIGRSSSEEARERYKRVADKSAARKKNTQMTYEDYLRETKDTEKLLELDDDSRWTKFKEGVGDYTSWLSEKRDKYVPVAVEKSKTVYKKQVQEKNYPTRLKQAAQKRLQPLYEKYGTKNVKYAGITSIAVLGLLGGFIIIRGGGSEVAVTEDGQVAGAEIAEPTFDVVRPNDEDNQVFFDPELGVASYQDTVGGKTVTISQQPISTEQQANKTEFLNQVAVNLKADVEFSTQFGPTHLSTKPDDTGDQVVFFLTDELLVFIRTRGESISPIEWTEYINSIST